MEGGASFVQVQVDRGISVERFVGFAKSWNFMKPFSSFSLPKLVKVKHLRDTNYKGMNLVSGFNGIYKVKLGQYSGKAMSQIVLTSDCDFDVNVNTIRDEFVRAVDETLVELKERATGRALQKKGYTTYAEALEYFTMGRDLFISIEEMSVDIETADILNFGASFNQHFEERLQKHIPDCRTYSVVKGYIKIQNWAIASHWWVEFDLEEFTEIAINFAKDLIYTDGCVLWNREALVELIGTGPCEEYYPGLIDKTGNFIFYDASKEKVEKVPQVVVLEFTNDLFTELHSKKKAKKGIFFKPLFAEMLACRKADVEFKRLKTACIANLTRFKDSVDEVLEPVSGFLGLAGRCEAVIACMAPERDSPNQMLERFQKITTLGAQNKGITTVIPMSVVRRHLIDTLLPVYCTLLDLVNTKIKGTTKKSVYMPSIDNLKLASVCEAILCFAIYGTALGMRGWPMHSSKLVDALELTKANFRLQREEKGLDRLKNVSVSAYRRIQIESGNIEIE